MNGQTLDDDTIVLILMAAIGLPAILGVVAAKVPDVAQLLVTGHILAAPDAGVLVEFPGTGGAGLDLARLIVVASVATICLVWITWLSLARYHNKKAEKG